MKFIYYVNREPIYESPPVNKLWGRKVYHCSHYHNDILTDSLSMLQQAFIKEENLPHYGHWKKKSFFCKLRKSARETWILKIHK